MCVLCCLGIVVLFAHAAIMTKFQKGIGGASFGKKKLSAIKNSLQYDY